MPPQLVWLLLNLLIKSTKPLDEVGFKLLSAGHGRMSFTDVLSGSHDLDNPYKECSTEGV
jgi:hypothetical protein